jgi:hypothetical protein
MATHRRIVARVGPVGNNIGVIKRVGNVNHLVGSLSVTMWSIACSSDCSHPGTYITARKRHTDGHTVIVWECPAVVDGRVSLGFRLERVVCGFAEDEHRISFLAL